MTVTYIGFNARAELVAHYYTTFEIGTLILRMGPATLEESKLGMYLVVAHSLPGRALLTFKPAMGTAEADSLMNCTVYEALYEYEETVQEEADRLTDSD